MRRMFLYVSVIFVFCVCVSSLNAMKKLNERQKTQKNRAELMDETFEKVEKIFDDYAQEFFEKMEELQCSAGEKLTTFKKKATQIEVACAQKASQTEKLEQIKVSAGHREEIERLKRENFRLEKSNDSLFNSTFVVVMMLIASILLNCRG